MVEEPEQDTQSDPESYVYSSTVTPLLINGIEKPMQWLSTVKTPSGKVTFKLDTGAETNVISS